MFERVARQYGFPTVAVPDSARTPEAVLRHLVAAFVARGLLAPAGAADAVVSHLLLRESLAPTGLGRGMALPHGMTNAVSEPVGAVGHAPHGVRWGPDDTRPVTAVCLLLCPASCEGLTLYLRMLEEAAREAAAPGPT